MSFLEQVRQFLRWPVLISDEGLAGYRRFLCDSFESWVTRVRDTGDARDRLRTKHLVERELARLPLVCGHLTRALVAAGVQADVVPVMVRRYLSDQLGLESGETLTVSQQMTLSAVTGALDMGAAAQQVRAVWRDPAAYALELGLVRRVGMGAEPTATGRACLDLAGFKIWGQATSISTTPGHDDTIVAVALEMASSRARERWHPARRGHHALVRHLHPGHDAMPPAPRPQASVTSFPGLSERVSPARR